MGLAPTRCGLESGPTAMLEQSSNVLSALEHAASQGARRAKPLEQKPLTLLSSCVWIPAGFHHEPLFDQQIPMSLPDSIEALPLTLTPKPKPKPKPKCKANRLLSLSLTLTLTQP